MTPVHGHGDSDTPRKTAGGRLIVFSDDWGRHPSSCQHLVKRLLPAEGGLSQRGVSAVGGWDVLWVNTIGMRKPRLTRADAKRALGRLFNRPKPADAIRGPQRPTDPRPRIVAPWMYPGFRTPWQRRFNAERITAAVAKAMRSPVCTCGAAGAPTVALTTLPITADLIERFREHPDIRVDRWVYYCVDDFSVWPGTDGAVMDAMEREQVSGLREDDVIVCVSEVLRDRVASMPGGNITENTETRRHGGDQTNRRDASRSIELLTHGVDLEFWHEPCGVTPLSIQVERGKTGPIGLFWGLIDDRFDMRWIDDSSAIGWLLVGPSNNPVAGWDTPNATYFPSVPYHELPALADAADVLIMPYVDAPVTRAMQPLKLLEYLAAGWPDRFKPVVVRDLPATRAWADCCDVVGTAEAFVRVCLERAEHGVPSEQVAARRRRLPRESWDAKAGRFERWLLGQRGEALTVG